MTNDKKLMKSGKAAEYLGVPHRTFQFWVKTRKLIPDVVTNGGHYFFSEENLARFKGTEEKTRNENSQNAQCEPPVDSKRAMVRLVEILPSQHFSGVTKLMRKLQAVEIGQGFKTAFDRTGNLYTFARLDYADEKVSFSGRFDVADELIMNALYSLTRNALADSDGTYPVGGKPTFSSRRILQHIFGNVADHFQDEIVEFVEKRLERLSWMKLTFDLRDNLGNSKAITVRGEKYRPVALRENLLDMSVVDFENETRERKFPVYKLNRKSPIFMYAEKLNQITSWSAHYMAVPCRKTIQNALIANYFLTKFSLIKNKSNHYLNTGILFDTFFKDLGLDVTTRKKKKVVRDTVSVMFDYWQKVGLISSWGFVKMGQAFYKIVFKVNLMGAEKC
jgi:DNA-binding transcriptional MerR regulator